MELVPSFQLLLQPLAGGMTAPCYASLVTVLSGWVFAYRRTITRMIQGAGESAGKHSSSYHLLFSAAKWSLDRLGLMVCSLIRPWCGEVVMLAHGRPRTAGMGTKVATLEAVVTRIKSPARTTRRGLRGPSSWRGWGRSFRSSAQRAAATSG